MTKTDIEVHMERARELYTKHVEEYEAAAAVLACRALKRLLHARFGFEAEPYPVNGPGRLPEARAIVDNITFSIDGLVREAGKESFIPGPHTLNKILASLPCAKKDCPAALSHVGVVADFEDLAHIINQHEDWLNKAEQAEAERKAATAAEAPTA